MMANEIHLNTYSNTLEYRIENMILFWSNELFLVLFLNQSINRCEEI